MHTEGEKASQNLYSLILNHRSAIIFLVVFLLNLLLISPQLMPEFSTVNPDDEAKYVESGWRLLRGDIRDLAWGPIVALVYAPVHLMVGANPNWFMLELWVGRFILYAFLWWSIFYLMLGFRDYVSSYVMLGALFVSTPFFAVLANQSDAVFVGFTCLALANLVKFYQLRQVKHLGFASLFVGLGVLARVETIVLLLTLVILGVLIGKGRTPLYKTLLAAIVPTLIIIGLYIATSLILMGKIDLGITYKSYDSFEMNQSILTGGDIDLARQETRRLFGTQEENQGSILRAILRNPAAFALRIFANAKTIPTNYLSFFGKKLGSALLLFAVFGVYYLIRRKAWILLTLLLLWPAHALVSLGFLALHIIPQIIYVPLLLGAIGITRVFSHEALRVEKLVLFLCTVLILILSWITNKPAFLICFLLLGTVILIYLLTNSGLNVHIQGLHLTILLLLAASLVLREPYQFPNYPVVGNSASETAIGYLQAQLPAQTTVLVPNILPAVAARMSFITMNDLPASIHSISDFWNYLQHNNVKAVYLDSHNRARNDIYDLMEQGFEQYFLIGFSSTDNSIRVFLVK